MTADGPKWKLPSAGAKNSTTNAKPSKKEKPTASSIKSKKPIAK